MVSRITQGALFVGVQGDGPSRVTQTALLVGVQLAEPIRLTQSALLVGVRSPKLGCYTSEAMLWKITRTDGEVFRFTSHNRAVTFRGAVYTPCRSLVQSAIQVSAEFGTIDNLDLSGIVADESITESDLYAGRFDGAEVEIWRVDWKTGDGALLIAGLCGSLTFDEDGFKFEVVTPTERMTQTPLLSPVMPTCRFRFGDERCTFDVASTVATGSVTALPAVNLFTQARRRAFLDATRAEAANFFVRGRLTWTSGANIGSTQDVKSFSSSAFVLETATQYPIEIGDAYSVVRGCDKSFTTCTGYANTANFGGFPHLKGDDDLALTPPVK